MAYPYRVGERVINSQTNARGTILAIGEFSLSILWDGASSPVATLKATTYIHREMEYGHA